MTATYIAAAAVVVALALLAGAVLARRRRAARVASMRRHPTGQQRAANTPRTRDMMAAPLIAVSARWPRVLHAAGMKTICQAWPDGTVTAPCGATRLRLYAGGNGYPLPWGVLDFGGTS